MAMTLTATTGTYIDPKNFGRYPNANIQYMGDEHLEDQSRFQFRFTLNTENGESIKIINWDFAGTTPSGNTIQNHGELILSANTSGATTIDFIQATLNGVDYDDPQHQIVTYPRLSYDDIDTYFILGNKKDKVQLPAGANPKKLVKWMLLNTVTIGRELIKAQFSW